MQVDVDARAVPLGQAEDDVEVAHRVAVHAGRVDPADHRDPACQGLVEELLGAGVGQDAVLWERHLLDAHPVREPGCRLVDRLDPTQPDDRVDVGVGADQRGAEGAHPLQQGGDPVDVRHTELCPAIEVVRDPVGERVAGRVRDPRPAVQRLVEVAVRLDQPGQQQHPGHVDRLRIAIGWPADRGDAAVLEEDVSGTLCTPQGAADQLDGGTLGVGLLDHRDRVRALSRPRRMPFPGLRVS